MTDKKFVIIQNHHNVDCSLAGWLLVLNEIKYLGSFSKYCDIAAVAVVSCSGPKKSPRTSSVVQIILLF